ncbi:M20 family metallopeptidase [Proteiniborus sp.]|uniref:M20 family metallopeptidase n=1 Tax=Proteiniborus sp. TaxID=2079015 RepID=UPI003328C025
MKKNNVFENVIGEIESKKTELINLSKFIWSNPELGYQEYKACKVLSDFLEKESFQITRKAAGLDTAFVAVRKGKKDGPCVALMSEYDALEGLGHACGHNLFSVSAVGAAFGLSKVIDEIGGSIMVLGTPAEEGTVPNAGGKIPMIEKGLFDNVDVAMICHAEGRTIIERILGASAVVEVEYTGKAAHAGGSPHEGINALSAGILAINNINALRQHFLPGAIVNVIISEGGIGQNTIPDKCVLKMSVRADKKEVLEDLLEKVNNCVKAGALATGCKYEISSPKKTYENLVPNHNLALSFKEALDYLGVPSIQSETASYGWDAGNVSHVCPTIAPYIKIGKENLVGHTDEFREASNSEEGFDGMLIGAKAMAITVIDYLTNKELREKVKTEFEAKVR